MSSSHHRKVIIKRFDFRNLDAEFRANEILLDCLIAVLRQPRQSSRSVENRIRMFGGQDKAVL